MKTLVEGLLDHRREVYPELVEGLLNPPDRAKNSSRLKVSDCSPCKMDYRI
jgi:hypothetical protein